MIVYPWGMQILHIMNNLKEHDYFGDKRYQIIELLSDGGSALVYKLYDCAAKIYRIGKFYSPAKRKHFDREKMILQNIRNENFVKYVDSFVIASQAFLVLTYVDGDILNANIIKPLFYRRSFLQCALQIQYLQNMETPVAHNDIKPSNIIYNYKEDVTTIIDYGCATKLNDAHSEGFSCTLSYATPELINFAQSNFSTDIYSLAKSYLKVLPNLISEDIDFYHVLKRCSCDLIENRFQNIKQVFAHLQKIEIDNCYG